MEESKTEEIFKMLCELPLNKWEVAENDKRNFVTSVGGVTIYLEFTKRRNENLVVYLSDDDSCFFIIENVQLVNQFRDKLLNYFEKERTGDKINELFNILTNSVCQSTNR